MKRDFTHENFERFLKQSADNLRMKAPEKVWQNLSKELNKRRRRFVFFLSAFLLVTSAAGYYTITAISNQSDTQPAKIIQQQPLNTNADPVEKQLTIPAEKTAVNQPSFVNLSRGTVATNKLAKADKSQPEFAMIQMDNPEITDNITDKADETISKNKFTPTIVDSYTEFDEPVDDAERKVKPAGVHNTSVVPLTIESVMNSFKAKSKKQKFEKQFYFAPTVSYRKLTENKSFLRTLDPNAVQGTYPALNSSVNNNVTHKPDIGFEAGFTTKYALSNKLKLRSGLQFNVNRYDVKAFSSPLAIATIALNNGVRVDSLSTISGYSNVSGYKSNWLQNFSFQVSAPLGVELVVRDDEKMQFGFATTVQPTYVLGDRAFLITTDYKNYTEVPWLIRRWNVNTALETFVIIKSGKTKWQVGPQVRYQLLSSFISEYPVKENLFDFGLKVGITLNQ